MKKTIGLLAAAGLGLAACERHDTAETTTNTVVTNEDAGTDLIGNGDAPLDNEALTPTTDNAATNDAGTANGDAPAGNAL